jgi:hypothetical protein
MLFSLPNAFGDILPKKCLIMKSNTLFSVLVISPGTSNLTG